MEFRDMRRFKQALDKKTCIDILTAATRGTLAVLGDGGYPYTVPMNFVYDSGKIYFHCALSGHKLDAINACDKVSFNVLGTPEKKNPADWWYYVKSVTVFGRASVVSDGEEKVAALTKLGNKYFPDKSQVAPDIERNISRTNVLCLRIEHMTGKQVEEK
ncbi:MAG: pyridoxamine 5'-phosphate oxidase family protein [Kiritimatiellae bacterium]|nr:pyridoxamine 5'-phosphate oxidase family protein [Kiritimatiellia bacterium]MBQ9516468.1 pyridoxamine 5'-phosphate oxidase family protein [Eubacterium sp.]